VTGKGHATLAELAVLTVAPEPSDPVFGYVAPSNLDELSEQIMRSYQHMLDCAVDCGARRPFGYRRRPARIRGPGDRR
jgi:hypothetical protein